MKICIVTHCVTKGDGQGRVNLEVAKQAIHRGHHITLLASSIAPELEQSSQVRWIPIPVKKWPTKLLRNLVFAWRTRTWLHQYRDSVDVVKINGAITDAPSDVNAVHFVHTSWLQFLTTEAKRSPYRLKLQKQTLRHLYQRFYTAINAYWEKSAFQKSRLLVAVSENVEKDLQRLGTEPQRIQVIPNGVDLQEFSPGYADRQIWNLPPQATLALFVGDVRTPRKNLDTVLQALIQVPELHLVVAGTTVGTVYPQLADSLNLRDRVHFLEYRSDVAELMKAVDFLVFPSRYETFGLVVIEAMASGLPVITASTTGAAGIVTPECGMVLSDADDVTGLAKALQILTSDRHLREQMGKAARAVAEQHSWKRMADVYIDLFEELSAS